MQCFKRIVSVPPNVKLIVIMGDNDIGGEGRDIMTERVLRYAIRTNTMNVFLIPKVQIIFHIFHQLTCATHSKKKPWESMCRGTVNEKHPVAFMVMHESVITQLNTSITLMQKIRTNIWAIKPNHSP